MDERFESITDQIDFYLCKHHDRGFLSKPQRKHLRELCEAITTYGEAGIKWAEIGRELLTK